MFVNIQGMKNVQKYTNVHNCTILYTIVGLCFYKFVQMYTNVQFCIHLYVL